jgi:hypothetical protein
LVVLWSPSCKIVALLTFVRIARFAALSQARFICHRQRSLSSPKAGAIAKLRYTSIDIKFLSKCRQLGYALVALLQNRRNRSNKKARKICCRLPYCSAILI